MSDKSGMQKATDAALMAKKMASITRAAAVAGIKGAAIQTAKEFSPILVKVVVAILILIVLIPFLIVAALPNIFFRYDRNTTTDIQAMTDKARIIENAYKSTKDYNEREVNRLIDELTKSGEYDDVEVYEESGSMNQYWFRTMLHLFRQKSLDHDSIK